jgi:ribosomal protein L30E
MEISEIKKILENDKAVFGINETLKLIEKKQIEEIVLSSNCPEDIMTKIVESEVKISEIDKTNQELGILCKKAFSVSVLGIKK